jgi:hypothetical protein
MGPGAAQRHDRSFGAIGFVWRTSRVLPKNPIPTKLDTPGAVGVFLVVGASQGHDGSCGGSPSSFVAHGEEHRGAIDHVHHRCRFGSRPAIAFAGPSLSRGSRVIFGFETARSLRDIVLNG